MKEIKLTQGAAFTYNEAAIFLQGEFAVINHIGDIKNVER